jgi:uncharacterized membrane protein
MMIDGLPRTLTVVAVVATGLVAGVFFAFSTFVMPGLRRLADRDGLRAMQGINEAAPASPLFVLVLVGTAVLGVGLGGWALSDLDEPAAPYLLAGGLLYLAAVAITGVYHIPRNDALGLVDPASADAVEAWGRYYRGWVAWNHVRTLAPTAAVVAYVLALRAT